jgi:hypothetical protein
LYEKLKTIENLDDFTKAQILALINDYKDYRSDTEKEFVLINDLLDAQFKEITNYSEFKLETKTGLDIVGCSYDFKNLIDGKLSNPIKNKLKIFFKTSAGTPILAKIILSGISGSFYQNMNDKYPNMWEKSEKEKADAHNSVVNTILTNQTLLGRITDILKKYADKALLLKIIPSEIYNIHFEVPSEIKPLIQEKLTDLINAKL